MVESNAENYEKQFVVKFRQSLKTYSILKTVRFFLRSVYIAQMFTVDDMICRFHFITCIWRIGQMHLWYRKTTDKGY